MFESNNQLQYSPSYTSTIHIIRTLEGFKYCTSFEDAIQTLTMQNYILFLLTISLDALLWVFIVLMWVDTKYLILTLEMCMAWLTLKEQDLCIIRSTNIIWIKNKYFQTLHTNSDSLFELRGIPINTELITLILIMLWKWHFNRPENTTMRLARTASKYVQY